LDRQVVRFEAAQDMEAVDRVRARAIVAREESGEMLARAQEIAPAHPVLLEYLFNEALREQDWPELELLVARATAADSDQAGGLIFRGRYELARKNYEQAIQTLTEATERKHYSAVAWRFLGRAHEGVGNFAEAVRAYEHSYTRNPNDRITIRWYVTLLLQTGERDRGLRVLRATKHTIPNDALLRERRLQLEAEVGDAVVAIRERRRNYALRPKDRVNAMRLAGLLTMTSPTYEHVVDDQGNSRYKADDWQLLSEKERRDRLAETADEWDRESKEILAAIEGEDGVEIAALRAELLMSRGLVDEGEQLLQAYRDLHSDDVRVYLLLGAYQRKAEHIDDAIATFESARQYQAVTRREADMRLADLYFDQARWSEAGELYEGVIEVNPSRGLQLRLVECFTKLERYDDARVALKQVVASGGQDFVTAMLRASIAEGLADALVEAGQAQSAELKDAEVLAALDEAERLKPSSHLPHVRRAQLLFKAFQRNTKATTLLDDALGALNHADRVRAGADVTSRVRVEILRAKGDNRGAIGELTRLLQLRPDNIEVRQLLVRMLAESGNHAGAMQVVNAAIERNPSIAMWHDARGELYLHRSITARNESTGRAEAARAAVEFRESHRLQPNAARLARSIELTLAGNDPDFAAVTSLIEATTDMIEGSPLLRGLYAAALAGEGRNTEALEQMLLAWGEHAEILELQPNDHRGLVNWYQTLQVVLSDRDPAEYEEVVRELTDGEPTPLSLVWSARTWGVGRDRENVMHAIALLDTAASRCPADDYALLRIIGLDRGMYHVGLGNYREAANSFEAVITLAAADPNVPEHTLALNNAAFLYVEYLDDPEQAAVYAQRAAAVSPGDPSILDTLGWALCRLGRYEEAQEALERSIEIGPSPDNQLHIAWVYYETGRQSEVRKYLLRAEALRPSPGTQDQIDELNKKLRR
ncbi:MAG: tetratricopeptide repeat protein, partial [Gemmatimonadales bacterium]